MKLVLVIKSMVRKIHESYQSYGLRRTLIKILEKLLLSSVWPRRVEHLPLYNSLKNSKLDNALETYQEYIKNHKAIKAQPTRYGFPENIVILLKIIVLNLFPNAKQWLASFKAQLLKQKTELNYPELPKYVRQPVPTKFPRSVSLNEAKILIIKENNTEIDNKSYKKLLDILQDQADLIDIKNNNQLPALHSILNFTSIITINLLPHEDSFALFRFAKNCYVPIFCWVDQPEIQKQLSSYPKIADFWISNNDIEIIGETYTQNMQTYYHKYLPKVSIVTILYKKSGEIEPVLQSYVRQSYQGEIEIIFVDDDSPDNSSEMVNHFFDSLNRDSSYPQNLTYQIIKNSKNSGNCYSRNLGIKKATGDLLIIIDADCLINKDFIENHVSAHGFDDCDISIGPFNIESGFLPPLQILDEFEKNPQLALERCDLQDPINKSSFLNCITRNFCIKKMLVTEELFDEQFSYSRKPDSGFGWEDVEMGYRLYKRGLHIKFISDAFSIHLTHPITTNKNNFVLRSLLNFRRLFEKHPDLLHVARRWSLESYEKICKSLDQNNLAVNDDRRFIDHLFKKYASLPFYINNRKRKAIKILTYPWHIPHQYEIYKLPYQFTLVTDLGTGISRGWDLQKRPIPNNIQFKSINDINPKDYDLAILHFDENVLSPEMTNGGISLDWGTTFKFFRNKIDLPKVAICHGTPQFYGQYDIDYNQPNLMQTMEKERQKIVEFLGDILTITNSYQANKEWNFRKTKVIWHGFDPTEFPLANYERGILSPYGTMVTSRPHYRGYFIFHEVLREFPKEFLPETLKVIEPDIRYLGNQYGNARFRSYVDCIRQYSIYFNPTIRSPMPRSRGEAMMCGLVSVSLKNHDVDLFITNGVNGFYSEHPLELREYLLYLLNNPEKAQNIGRKSRELAMDVFNHDRFLKEWEQTINQII